MMLVFKRRRITAALLAVLIVVAGYLTLSTPDGMVSDEAVQSANTPYMGEAQMVSGTAVADDFFAQARLDREEGRSKSIETFNSVINNESAEPSAREAAASEVLAIAENTEKETAVENLIRAKGYTDAVCYISNGQANIVVKGGALDAQSAAKISEIVTEQTGIPTEKVKIVEMQ